MFAQFQEDMTWYRATVVSKERNSAKDLIYLVEFLDYGNQDICSEDQVVGRLEDIPLDGLVDEIVGALLGEISLPNRESEQADSPSEVAADSRPPEKKEEAKNSGKAAVSENLTNRQLEQPDSPDKMVANTTKSLTKKPVEQPDMPNKTAAQDCLPKKQMDLPKTRDKTVVDDSLWKNLADRSNNAGAGVGETEKQVQEMEMDIPNRNTSEAADRHQKNPIKQTDGNKTAAAASPPVGVDSLSEKQAKFYILAQHFYFCFP